MRTIRPRTIRRGWPSGRWRWTISPAGVSTSVSASAPKIGHRGRLGKPRHPVPVGPGATPGAAAGPALWIAAMSPGALAVTARHAEGWEASYLTLPDFRARWERLASALERGGRSPKSMARSIEVDVALTGSRDEAATALAGFLEARGLGPNHPLQREKIAAYAAAGATDLTLAFADFPAIGMLERLALEVLTP